MARPQGPRWQCITGCGACCRLDPALRVEDLEALSPDQRQLYLAMVGADGWCIHYDTGGRKCRIYADRPDFCQVSNLLKLFGAQRLSSGPQACTPGSAGNDEAAAHEALAIASCLQQIRAEYGGRGRVMRRFQRVIRRRP